MANEYLRLSWRYVIGALYGSDHLFVRPKSFDQLDLWLRRGAHDSDLPRFLPVDPGLFCKQLPGSQITGILLGEWEDRAVFRHDNVLWSTGGRIVPSDLL